MSTGRPMDGAGYGPTGLAHPLLSRLEGVRPAGPGRWYARCPAHGDKTPSLSVRDTGDRVLLYCFTGCHPTDILTAVGLTWTDLYPDRWEAAAKRPNEAAHAYARRTLPPYDTTELDRLVLKIAAADRRLNKPQSLEDRARIELAIQRLGSIRNLRSA